MVDPSLVGWWWRESCSVPALDGAAQTSTGGLRGFVRDNSDLVMVGVTVEASSPARIGGPAVAVTDPQGVTRSRTCRRR